MNLSESLTGLLARCRVLLANSGAKLQTLQVRILAGETKGDVEHFEPYGFTSCPLAGAEGLVGFPGADRSHAVLLVVTDRRSRVTGLEAGEVAIYTHEGAKIVLKNGRVIEVECDEYRINTQRFVLDADSATVSCVIEAPDLTIGDVSHAGHRHNETGSITEGPRS